METEKEPKKAIIPPSLYEIYNAISARVFGKDGKPRIKHEVLELKEATVAIQALSNANIIVTIQKHEQKEKEVDTVGKTK